MFWNAIAGAIQGGIGSKAFRAATEANNRLRRVNVEARDKVRQAGNLAEAAQNNLSRWVQSVNNNRRLKAGGEALEAHTVNVRRGLDAAEKRQFSNDITSAEQQGRMAASAAFSGVAGDVVDMVDLSVNLRNTIVEQAFKDQQGSATYDATRRAGNIMSQMVGGLDNSVIIDSLDYNVDALQQDVQFSGWQHAMFGMIKHMGGITADAAPKDTTQDTDSYKLTSDINESTAASGGGQHGFALNENDRSAQFSFEKDKNSDPYNLWGEKTNDLSSSFSGSEDASFGKKEYSF
jgi:hypothetical protein